MKLVFGLILLTLAAFPLVAQSDDENGVAVATEPPIIEAVDTNLTDFLWLKRPVVIFADTPADPSYQRQLDLFNARLGALSDRDVVIVTDTDPAARSEIRLKLRPRGFMLALIGKDGQVKLRKPVPWDVRELTRVIDKMPMRQQELRDRRAASRATSSQTDQ